MLLLSVMRFMPLGYTGQKYRHELNLPSEDCIDDEGEGKDFSDILTDFFMPGGKMKKISGTNNSVNNHDLVLSSMSNPMMSTSIPQSQNCINSTNNSINNHDLVLSSMSTSNTQSQNKWGRVSSDNTIIKNDDNQFDDISP